MNTILIILIVYLVGIPVAGYIYNRWVVNHTDTAETSIAALLWPFFLLLVIMVWGPQEWAERHREHARERRRNQPR